jgi:hypothetical protein
METLLDLPIATSVVPKPRGRSTAPRPRRFNRILVPIGVPNFFLNLRDDVDLSSHLRMERLERAIGVIYRPETELVVITSMRDCQINSTRSCITITLAQRSRWSAQRNGKRAKWKKHFRVAD